MPVFGRNEKVDLIVSWLTISVAFSSFSFLLGKGFGDLFTALVAVGTGFICHELAHRQVARMFKAHSKYAAWDLGLIFTLATAVLAFLLGGGLIFGATGAVYIYGPHITRRQNGIISAAGPATNILIAVIFIIGSTFLGAGFLHDVFIVGAYINFFLALFNLLPVRPLDGAKVMLWEPWIWGIMFATAGVGVFFFRAVLAFFGAAA